MKTTTLIASLCYLLITATYAVGQSAPDTRPEGAPPRGSSGESRILQHLLQMDDEGLANLHQTIERIQKMSPQEKAQLRERIGKIDRMAPEKVAAMRKKYEAIPREQREAMRERWMAMSPEEHKEWRQKLKKMSPAERKAVFEAQGFLAPHPHRDKKGLHALRPADKRSLSESGTKPDVEP